MSICMCMGEGHGRFSKSVNIKLIGSEGEVILQDLLVGRLIEAVSGEALLECTEEQLREVVANHFPLEVLRLKLSRMCCGFVGYSGCCASQPFAIVVVSVE